MRSGGFNGFDPRDAVTVTTGSPTHEQGPFARDALRSQRERLVDLFAGFDEGTWAAPTRCSEWSVHEVVRHLCDTTFTWIALLRDEPAIRGGFAPGFDPRTTPVEWLERSADETPADTLRVFEEASAVLVDVVDELAAGRSVTRVPLPYGTVAWSAAVLHVFWDAWLHERDILLPLALAPASPAVESRAAAVYGLVMSGVPSALLGQPYDETLVLRDARGVGGVGVGGGGSGGGSGGGGGGVYALEVRGDVVTVRVDDGTVGDGGGPLEGEPLVGELVDVVDALAGRAWELPDALGGPADRLQRLGVFARFIGSPVG